MTSLLIWCKCLTLVQSVVKKEMWVKELEEAWDSHPTPPLFLGAAFQLWLLHLVLVELHRSHTCAWPCTSLIRTPAMWLASWCNPRPTSSLRALKIGILAWPWHRSPACPSPWLGMGPALPDPLGRPLSPPVLPGPGPQGATGHGMPRCLVHVITSELFLRAGAAGFKAFTPALACRCPNTSMYEESVI